MRINFEYGPNLKNAEDFDVGPVTMNRNEAMALAFAIMTHYTPPAVKKVSPEDIEHRPIELLEKVPHGTKGESHG